MTKCSICNKRINGEPYICQPDGTFIHTINSPVCPTCFKAWAAGDYDNLIKIVRERWKK